MPDSADTCAAFYWAVEEAFLLATPKPKLPSLSSSAFFESLIDDIHAESFDKLFSEVSSEYPFFAYINNAVTSGAFPTSGDDAEAYIKSIQRVLETHLGTSENKRADELQMLALGILCLRIYLRTNWTGPKFDQTVEGATRLPVWLTPGDPSWNSDSSPAFNTNLKKALAYEGEIIQDLVHLPMALVLARMIFYEVLGTSSIASLPVWQARVALVHQRSLSGGRRFPCPGLMAASVSGLVQWLQASGVLSSEFSIKLSTLPKAPALPPHLSTIHIDWSSHGRRMMHLELAAVLSTYGLHDAFKTLFAVSRDVLGFSAQLSGRLGIKRKYQQDALPQLVLEMIGEDANHSDDDHPKADVPGTEQPEPRDSGATPVAVKLMDIDPETDVLEDPQLQQADAINSDTSQPLSVDQQLFLLAWSNCLFETAPAGDELAMQVILAIIRECVKLPKEANTEDEFHDIAVGEKQNLMLSLNWLVFSYGLWMRSKSEFNRSKWKERSCLQMMHLEDQFKDATPSAGHRLRYIFQLDFPNIWEMKIEAGRRFMKIGAVLTAKKMFEDMQMWDECVQCLAVAQRKNEALDLVRKKIAEAPTPALYSSLGDLTEDAEAYTKAWELSDHKYCRAARSLGSLAFKNRDLEKAIVWFECAVKLQPMQARTLFTLGCCLMRTGNFGRAQDVFGRVTAVEPDNAEAWANLASLHVRKEDWSAAKRCIALAAKEQRNSWQVWDSYAKISMKSSDIYGALEACGRLVELDRASEIEMWMLNFFAKELMTRAQQLGKDPKDETVSEQETQGVKLAFENLLKRCLEFFAQYFSKHSLPLLNDPRSQDTVDSVVDSYRIWSVITQLASLKRTTWEIRLKQLRHLDRVIADVGARGVPSRLHPAEGKTNRPAEGDQVIEHQGSSETEVLRRAFDQLLNLLAQSINELLSYIDVFRTTLSEEAAFLSEMETVLRFLHNLFNGCEVAIKSTSLPIENDARSALVAEIQKMQIEVDEFVEDKMKLRPA